MAINSLQTILESYRDNARTQRDKGTYFERLAVAYPLTLFQRVITVSLETIRIVRALPRLDIA